jgi:polar amino acid transport system substrate-binding protein
MINNRIILFLIICTFSFSGKAMEFYTINLPPFSLVKGDNVSGPFHEIASKVCEISKFNCGFHSSPWKRIMSGVKSGHYNACYVVGKNKQREEWMWFSSPVVKTEYGFFSLQGHTKEVKDFKDLRGATIIVHAKSNTHRQLLKLQKKHPYFKINVHNDVLTALKMFAKKRFSAMTYLYGNKHSYLAIYKQRGESSVRYSLSDKKIFYRFGFSKKSVSKKDFQKFEEALKIFKGSDTYSSILSNNGLDLP